MDGDLTGGGHETPEGPAEACEPVVADCRPAAHDQGTEDRGVDPELFQKLLDASPVGFCMVGPGAGRVLFFNEGFLRIWGLEAVRDRLRSGSLNGDELCNHLLARAADPAAFAAIWGLLQDGENAQIVYKEFHLGDGSLIELFSTPVRDAGGRYRGRLFVFEDMRGKRATFELEATNRALTDEIVKRAALFDQLHEQQAMLAHAEKIALLGSWTIDLVNEKAVYSEELVRILELQPGTTSSYLDLLANAVHHEDRERYVLWTKALAKKQGRDRIDFRLARKNGALRYIHCEVEHEHDASGRAVRMFGSMQDMTEIMEARARLKRLTDTEVMVSEISRRLMHLSYQDIDAEIKIALKRIGQFARADRSFILLLSSDGQVMDNTHEWCAEGIGSRHDRLQGVQTSHLPWLFQRLKMFGAVNVTDVAGMPDIARREREILLSDGLRSFAMVPMIYGGTLIGLIGLDGIREARAWSTGDVAMLKQAGGILTSALLRSGAEMAIVESEARLRLVTDTVGFPMLMCDSERIIYANAAASRTTGYTVGELEAMRITDIVHPGYRDLVMGRLAERLKGRKVTPGYEIKIVRRDGAERWLEVSAGCGELSGKLVDVVAGTDITERKLEEQSMRQKLTEQEALIKKLTAALDINK